MGRNKIRNYYDGIIPSGPEVTIEEIDEEIRKADEESNNLTEWPRL